MGTTFILAQLFAIILVLTSNASGLGLTCSEHPGYSSGLIPSLPKSWKILTGSENTKANYHVNPPSHAYAPKDNPTSTKYSDLDLFWVYQSGEGPEYVRLELQRSAKIYLLVTIDYDADYPSAELAGWKAEEYVELVKGKDERLVYGVHQKNDKYVPGRAYAFSNIVDGEVILPSGEWVKDNIRGNVKSTGDWIVLLAEEDGSAPKIPESPNGIPGEIKANERCPNALHDLWVTGSTDDNDPDIEQKKWSTWHPMWDPCFWCAYDHDHGSSPKHLMGYEPKFGYVAWKNGRETEIHEGFKGVVFKEEDYLVYFMMHGQTSNVRRLGIRFHTMTLVVVDATSKKLLLEIAHKGDYGFISARKAGGGVVPLSKEDEELEKMLEEEDLSNHRTVNVINLGNLDPRFEYEEDILRGRYEEWTTTPICSRSGRKGALRMDFTHPITGIKVADDLTSEIALGSENDDEFIKHDGLGRIFRAREYRLSERSCMFHLEDIEGGASKDGAFYTDATGTKLLKGPGINAVKQFVTPGFSMSLDGDYEAIDSWTGMFEKGVEGRMINYGYGIDPVVN